MIKRKAFFAALLAAVLGAGCGGFSASRSVSPLDFILPGIMQDTPAAPPGLGQTNGPPILAQADGPGDWLR